MLKIEEIREIIKLIDQSSIDEFTYEGNNEKIKLKKKKEVIVEREGQVSEQVSAPVLSTPPSDVQPIKNNPLPEIPNTENTTEEITSDLVEVVSPMVGTFYAASSPDAEDYVKVGSKVTETSIVCIVEAMKLFNEIEAETKGEIVEILVKDGQLVEYGQALFLVKPE